MRTYLGASLRTRRISPSRTRSVRRRVCSTWRGTRRTARPARRRCAAKAKGALVSLDLASFEVVRNCKATLVRILRRASSTCSSPTKTRRSNSPAPARTRGRRERGATTTTKTRRARPRTVPGTRTRSSRARMRRGADVDASPLSRRHRQSGRERVRDAIRRRRTRRRAGRRVPVVDTTGAGDSFTAGFLSAYLAGASLQACASCGCAVGTQVVQVLGAELPASRWAALAEHTAGMIERDAARAAEAK